MFGRMGEIGLRQCAKPFERAVGILFVLLAVMSIFYWAAIYSEDMVSHTGAGKDDGLFKVVVEHRGYIYESPEG